MLARSCDSSEKVYVQYNLTELELCWLSETHRHCVNKYIHHLHVHSTSALH